MMKKAKIEPVSQAVLVLTCLVLILAYLAYSREAAQPPVLTDEAQNEAREAEEASASKVEGILGKMSTDEKVSQMIVPAIRTWNGAGVTNLFDVPELSEALRRHQYGGVILFADNMVDSAQTARLVEDLQANNAAGSFSSKVPYLMPVDEEGGAVVRFGMGTRTAGNMAVGATGADAEQNACLTGQILGRECAALGFNVNLAPSVDVNNDPANPVIGVRSFSDDPEVVGRLGAAYCRGVSEQGVIPTLKHFPGHGDTDTDTHLDTVTINKTAEELEACELVPFRATVNQADLVMSAHITLPGYDDEQPLADGSTGYVPATMSYKVLTTLLRDDMGFKGVVITDALEMDAIENMATAVSASDDYVVQRADIARSCIGAGADILLIPADLDGTDDEVNKVDFYDSYIQTLVLCAEDDAGLMARIDQSVGRILALKEKYGLLDGYKTAGDLSVVGSAVHHDAEMRIARAAVTLVKNDSDTLPLAGHGTNVVLLGCDAADNVALAGAVRGLQDRGLVDRDARIHNLAADQDEGPEDAATNITIGYCCDGFDSVDVRMADDLEAVISAADAVVVLTKNRDLFSLQPGQAQYEGVVQAREATHEAGGKFVLLSGNLPYDLACHMDSDAIMCSYMGEGTDVDSATMGAYNANVLAAMETIYGYTAPAGTLPVRIPAITTDEDGSVAYDMQNTLFERGFGLGYR